MKFYKRNRQKPTAFCQIKYKILCWLLWLWRSRCPTTHEPHHTSQVCYVASGSVSDPLNPSNSLQGLQLLSVSTEKSINTLSGGKWSKWNWRQLDVGSWDAAVCHRRRRFCLRPFCETSRRDVLVPLLRSLCNFSSSSAAHVVLLRQPPGRSAPWLWAAGGLSKVKRSRRVKPR